MRKTISLNKKREANKGITLIALVITIIVLLILAAISIATLTGENGILTKANTAKTITEEEGIKEEIKLAYNAVQTDAILEGWDSNKKAEELQKELRKEDKTATVTVEGTNLKVSYKGVELIINDKGEITIVDSKVTIQEFSIKGTKVTSITPPDGFVHVGGTIEEGYVISDEVADENKGVDANLVGNQFVWVPVEKDQKITVKVSSEENITSLVITDPYGDDIVTENNKGKQYSNTEIVPTVNGPYRLLVTTESGEVKKSFLSVHSLYAVDTFLDWQMNDEYAKAQGEESIKKMIDEMGFQTVEEAMFAVGSSFKQMYTETENYKEKVNTNGGFYIGRYEVGNSSEEMVTKKNQTVYNYITQTEALGKAKGYKSNLSSSLLTGAAWDRTMGWLYETGEKTTSKIAIDSVSWGNYNNDTFSNTTGLIKTGEFGETKANNIYDLAGNVEEWTTEACATGYRVIRGGRYRDDGSRNPASYRYDNSPGGSSAGIGFRVALYL